VTDAHELTRAEEAQAIALIPAMFEELRAARAELAEMRASLPPRFVSLKEAAEVLGVDPRTVSAMAARNEVVTRRCGRRIVVDAVSLRPTDPASVARLAREARGS
jgi:hypothetical protein